MATTGLTSDATRLVCEGLSWVVVSLKKDGWPRSRIHGEAMRGVRGALDGNAELGRTVEVDGRPEEKLTSAGVMRDAFERAGVNLTCQVQQERCFAVAERALLEVLNRCFVEEDVDGFPLH
jgi:hypothetical protein